MIILYTKKLQELLEIPGRGIPLPEATNEDAYWHGNIFLYKRKKVLQLTHEKTRYTIFIHGITKKDIKNINKLIVDNLKYNLLKDGVPLSDMIYILSLSNAFSFFKRTDRKVLGTMNNMRDIYEHLCETNSTIDDKIFSHYINNMLFQVDGKYKEPAIAFKEYMCEATLAYNFIKEEL